MLEVGSLEPKSLSSICYISLQEGRHDLRLSGYALMRSKKLHSITQDLISCPSLQISDGLSACLLFEFCSYSYESNLRAQPQSLRCLSHSVCYSVSNIEGAIAFGRWVNRTLDAMYFLLFLPNGCIEIAVLLTVASKSSNETSSTTLERIVHDAPSNFQFAHRPMSNLSFSRTVMKSTLIAPYSNTTQTSVEFIKISQVLRPLYRKKNNAESPSAKLQ